jgi:hypothetical protein
MEAVMKPLLLGDNGFAFSQFIQASKQQKGFNKKTIAWV